ncbi:hypothetical protein [Lacrimispora sp.]|uniref:hypothetical protein n=1 Tax=Lacrimispora sp. TaxID=2719234 RepID=UPI0028ABA3E8|nr:hypothetical protein [Lacrimispora sp.]
MIDLLKTARSIQLSLPFFFMMAYSLGITYLFYRTSLWKSIFIKDIVLWVIFVGTPLFFGSINKSFEEHYFRKAVVSNFKLTVLTEFFVSSFTFPLIWEIIMVPVLVFIFMLDAIAATNSEYRPAKKLISVIIIIINIIFLYETVSIATCRLGTLNVLDTLITLLIPIVFSVLYIPISYMFTVFGKYQIVFVRMGFKESKDNAKIKILHRFKIIWICKFSLSNLCKFGKSYIQHMYVGMSGVEFDKLMKRFKLNSINQSLDKQYTKEEKKLINELKESNFFKKIEYINDHVGIFTFMFTLAIGLTSILLKGFFYVFICGKLDYWGISHTYINISNENMLYIILLFAAGSIIYIALNYIPFAILTSKKTWYKKLFKLIILLTFTSGGLFVFFLLNEVTVNHNFILNSQTVIQLAIDSLILTVLGYILGLLMPISFRNQKDKSKNGEVILLHKLMSFSTLFILIFGISLYVFMAYAYGRDMAAHQKSYKIIDNNYAVIYEDVEYVIVSDYDVINDNILVIDSTAQTLIKKENIKTDTKIFNKVERKDNK